MGNQIDTSRPLYVERVNAVIDYVEQHLCEELTLEPTLNLLQDSDEAMRKKGAQALVETAQQRSATAPTAVRPPAAIATPPIPAPARTATANPMPNWAW